MSMRVTIAGGRLDHESFIIPGVSYATFFTGKEGDDEAVPAFKIVLKNASKFPQSVLSGYTATDKTSRETQLADPAPVPAHRRSCSLLPSLPDVAQRLSLSQSRSRNRSEASRSEQGLASGYLQTESQATGLRNLLKHITPHAYQQSLEDWYRDQPQHSSSEMLDDEVEICLKPQVVNKDEAIPYGGSTVNLARYFGMPQSECQRTRPFTIAGREKLRTSTCKEDVTYLPADERDYLLELARVTAVVEARREAENDAATIRANVREIEEMFGSAKEGREKRRREWGSEASSSYKSTAEEGFLVLLQLVGLVKVGGNSGLTLLDPHLYRSVGALS